MMWDYCRKIEEEVDGILYTIWLVLCSNGWQIDVEGIDYASGERFMLNLPGIYYRTEEEAFDAAYTAIN